MVTSDSSSAMLSGGLTPVSQVISRPPASSWQSSENTRTRSTWRLTTRNNTIIVSAPSSFTGPPGWLCCGREDIIVPSSDGSRLHMPQQAWLPPEPELKQHMVRSPSTTGTL